MASSPNLVGTVTAVVLAMLMAACTRDPPEQRLRDALSQLQLAVETRDASDLQEALAADFVGPDGLDRDGARRLAQGFFLRHRDIGATLGPPRIEIRGDHATIRFTAALTGGAGGVWPDSAGIHDVETAWRIEDGEWRLISAQWAPRL